MAKFVDIVGRTVGVVIDADTAMADYTPSVKGRLKKIKVLPGGIAATTLIENGYIRLSCKTFGGVDVYAPFNGGGAFTAPHMPSSYPTQDTECDVACEPGVPIHVYYYHNVIPTTPEITVFAEIEA